MYVVGVIVLVNLVLWGEENDAYGATPPRVVLPHKILKFTCSEATSGGLWAPKMLKTATNKLLIIKKKNNSKFWGGGGENPTFCVKPC